GRQLAVATLNRMAIEPKLDDVGNFDQARAHRARQEEASVIEAMPHADVAEGVDDAQIGEDAIGNHQIFDNARDVAHGGPIRKPPTVGSAARAGNLLPSGLVVRSVARMERSAIRERSGFMSPRISLRSLRATRWNAAAQ